MERIKEHFEHSFEQPLDCIFHSVNKSDIHIDILCFKPTELYPFWKIVTMGASDIVMPFKDNYGSKRNEYMMFVDKNVDLLNDYEWYVNWLCLTVEYTLIDKQFITFNHSIEIPNIANGGDMKGVIILLPAILYDGNVLHCKLGLFKQATCLQVMPITQSEIDGMHANGYEWLVSRFYPFIYGDDEHQNDEEHYLAEKTRTF